jgi:hypothetical protein
MVVCVIQTDPISIAWVPMGTAANKTRKQVSTHTNKQKLSYGRRICFEQPESWFLTERI